MPAPGAWGDLSARLATGIAMATLGIGAIAIGGWVFAGLAAAVSGIMIWELARMLDRGGAPRLPGLLAVLCGVAVLVAWRLPPAFGLALLAVPALIGTWRVTGDRALFLAFALAILVAGYGLASFREAHGVVWLIWLVLVVIATDVAGYFAGRFIGGPKFWARVSPSKTWAGTLGGWFAAMLIGLVFLTFTNAGTDLPWISMLLSLASQMGDVAESALKRRVGVKDSSSLLPGHGGLFDRFDGLLGASLFMLLVAQLVYVPEVRF